jgi:excisionase family DNA binding protein
MAKRQELNVTLRYVSSRVASEILGVQAQTLRRWAKAGKIGAIRTPGNQWRYDLSGLIVAPTPAAQPQISRKKAKTEEFRANACDNKGLAVKTRSDELASGQRRGPEASDRALGKCK